MKTTPPDNAAPGTRPVAPGPADRQSALAHHARINRAWSPATRRGVVKPQDRPPTLRLAQDLPTAEHLPTSHARPASPTPISGATDPRWVLAVRTAESLQGDVLPPANRDRLMRLAKTLGLTPFDGCLILAMIQDQARRGLIAQHCPAAAQPQLAMVPLPQPREFFPELRKNPLRICGIAAGILAMQALIVWVLIS
ncbi:MAG: hypothetical protein AAGA29_04255 [Planctomycetota bacterium]